ncbi:MAG: DUF898 family protein [Phreatobacter sp.]|uniref:DUF898 family protein n=1 Tax=Phreatobacter sp. TaxID=1966341 RepID=UPI001A58D81B|nr:DUF898 family protein [Phreatobacter sp.]MBL8568904.1 DUF898 family protein [Phreatobacter sp.]
MTDATQPGSGAVGPWGARSTAAAVAAAEQAARASVPPIAPGASQPASGVSRIGFTGAGGQLLGLLVKGMLLQLVTLGIYRFWFITDMRRFYWSHTRVGPEEIAYTGRGLELFKGFLVALAIIVPIQAAGFFVVLGLPSAEVIVSFSVTIIFLFLSQYAAYAGRRYRLTRTAFRGLRLRMVGSAWTYAAKAFGLWILVILSLGLAYPWVAAILERIKMRDTWYGDAQGAFVGTAGTLFRRGILIWALGFGLPLLMIGSTIASVPYEVWREFGATIAAGNIEPAGRLAVAIYMLMGAVFTALVIPILLFPAFQAVVFRWRMEGVRLGGAALASDFRIRAAYRVYLLGALGLIGIGFVIALIVGLLFGGLIAAVFFGGGSDFASPASGIVGIATIALAYLFVFGGFWVAKQILITLRLYRAQARSVSVMNLAALDNVRANNVDASAMGDSLGDAVDVLGF